MKEGDYVCLDDSRGLLIGQVVSFPSYDLVCIEPYVIQVDNYQWLNRTELNRAEFKTCYISLKDIKSIVIFNSIEELMENYFEHFL